MVDSMGDRLTSDGERKRLVCLIIAVLEAAVRSGVNPDVNGTGLQLLQDPQKVLNKVKLSVRGFGI